MSNHDNNELFEFMLKQALNEYANDEGNKYIAELNSLEEPPYSESYQHNLDKLLKSQLDNKHYYVPKIAAIVVACIICGTSFVYNVNADFRLYFNNIISDMGTNLDISRNETALNYDFSSIAENWEYFYIPEYIPEGYTVKTIDSSPLTIFIVYTNEDDKEICWSINNSSKNSVSLDTAHSELTNIKIGNSDGYYQDSGETKSLIWFDREFTFSLSGDLDKGKLIKIGESIKLIER